MAAGEHGPVELVGKTAAQVQQEHRVVQKLLPVLFEIDREGIDAGFRLHKKGGELGVDELNVTENVDVVVLRQERDGGFLIRHFI